MSRLAAIGFDAAEWELIQPMLDAGQLPNLKRIAAAGVHARLQNGLAYRFGMVFQQLLYGHEAQLRDDWDSMLFNPQTYMAYQRNAGMHGHRKTFFEADPSLFTIAFDVPQLGLGGQPNTVEVTSWGASAPMYPRASHPAGLLREIDATFGPHPSAANDYECGWHDVQRIEAMVDGLVAGARRRVEICQWLQKRFPQWDLFLVVMSESHSAGEYLWQGIDPSHPINTVVDAGVARAQLERTYRALDDAVGQFEAGLPEDTTLVVFSLYGTATSPGDVPSIVLLPELLHRATFGEGHIRSARLEDWAATGYRPEMPGAGQRWDAAMDGYWTGPPPAPESKLQAWRSRAARTLRSPASMVRSVASRMDTAPTGVLGVPIEPETRLSREEIRDRGAVPLAWLFTDRYRRWWPEMPFFALPTFSDGLVRINLQGRERRGTVAAAEYGAACDRVEQLLEETSDPRTGGPVVLDVSRPRASAPFDPDGSYADLIIRWARPLDAFTHPRHGLIGPVPFHRTGTHSPNGFCYIHGEALEPRDAGTRPALDMTATLLGLLGRPTCGIDGHSLVDSPSP